MLVVLVLLSSTSLSVSLPVEKRVSTYPKYHAKFVNKTTACHGTIDSPNFPHPYDKGYHGYYSIRVPSYHQIILRVAYLDLGSFTECENNYVAIHDGSDANSTIISQLCGNQLIEPQRTVVSTGNVVYVRFITDGMTSAHGFQIDYQARSLNPENKAVCLFNGTTDTDGCDGITFFKDPASSGQLTSPNFPSTYPSNKTCHWRIDVTGYGNSIELDWSSFSLEPHALCVFDYIKILNSSGHLFAGPFCKNPPDSEMSIPGSTAFIVFHSDLSNSYQGFKLSYRATGAIPNISPSVLQSTPPAPKIECDGGIVSGEFGSISSPNYPLHYENNMNCEWIITVPYGYARVRAHKFDLESSDSCQYDSITVSDGETNAILGRFCGDSMDQIIATSSTIKVVFSSDEATTGRGFLIDYDALEFLPNPCVHTKTIHLDPGTTMEVKSPNYPQYYDNNLMCSWLFVAPQGYTVGIEFVNFNLEERDTVQQCNDYVQFYHPDGTNTDKLCGSNFPADSLPTSQSRRMVLFSNGMVRRTGFKMHVSAKLVSSDPCSVPGVTLSKETGTIISPNHPDRYGNNMHCQWMISHGKSSMTLSAETFNIEEKGRSGCWDYVIVSSSEGEVGKFCGRSFSQLMIPGPTAIITLVTDGSVRRTGFKFNFLAEWYLSVTSTQKPTVITTTTPTTTTTHLTTSTTPTTTTTTTTPTTTTTTPTTTTTTPTPTTTTPTTTTTTPTTTTTTPTTTTTTPTTTTTTQSSAGLTTYTCQPSKDIIANNGYFVSPNYPADYENRQTCVWKIRITHQDKWIKLTSADFDLESSGSFCYDKLQIKAVSKQINYRPYCGTTFPELLINDYMIEVTFSSDTSIVRPGFKIRFEAVSPPPEPTIGPFVCGRPAIHPCLPLDPSGKKQCSPTYLSVSAQIPGGGTIVGGEEAVAHSYPWQVALVRPTSKFQFCAGTIVNPYWIITAAHCVNGQSVNDLKIAAGVHDKTAPFVSLSISEIKIHPDYNANTFNNDIALLKLVNPLTFTDTVQPACVASEHSGHFSGVSVVVTGWGALRNGGSSSSKLQEVQVDVLSQYQCRSSYGSSLITNSMLCASQDGKDACQGDSGGPLVAQRADGAYELIGIVSWGYGCAQPGYPGVYTRVSEVSYWLRQHIAGV